MALGEPPRYAPGFSHFDYVNPNAPKGGRLLLPAMGSFDSLNPYTLKGDKESGLGLLVDTLMEKSLDEPFAMYGLLADDMALADDGLSVRFHLNPAARFSDGSPVLAPGAAARDRDHAFPRAELTRMGELGKPLGKERWAGAVDVAGGHVLANVCASMQYQGVVTACGLAAGMALPATVAPFILRGVTLAGVDSVMRPRADRLVAWQRLTQELSLDKLALIGSQEVGLDEAIGLAARLLKGEVRGRVVVDVNR